MRSLVTGGAGFIGSHITERLVHEGHAVRVLDDLSTGRLANLAAVRAKVEFVQGDIRDRRILSQAMQGVEYVIHEAAWRSVPKSMQDPCGYTDVDVLGTVNVLEEARSANVKRVVFASSSSVYGDTDQLPLREQQPMTPISPYALSKLAGEQYCRLFAGSFGLETVSVRYFNVFGPRQSLDNEYAVVVPKFITCVLRGDSPPIYGDGRQSRDFTFVDNVVDATVRVATAPGVSGEVFNVACGEMHTVRELLEEINRILGRTVPPTFVPPRPGDVKRTAADISKISRSVGWKPTVTFAEGLARTIRWFQAHAAQEPSPAQKAG